MLESHKERVVWSTAVFCGQIKLLRQNFTPLYPPLQVRAGLLVVDGYGIALFP